MKVTVIFNGFLDIHYDEINHSADNKGTKFDTKPTHRTK